MSPATRWEYVRAIHPRYGQAGRKKRHRMLDECCAVTGYHRKYAIRLLHGPPPTARPHRPRRRPVTYSGAVIDALTAMA